MNKYLEQAINALAFWMLIVAVNQLGVEAVFRLYYNDIERLMKEKA